jgi:hypothetical protein
MNEWRTAEGQVIRDRRRKISLETTVRCELPLSVHKYYFSNLLLLESQQI